MAPDDDGLPDEVWYKCPDCDGEGTIDLPDDAYDYLDDDEMPASSSPTCGECDGMGRIEGSVEAEDMELAKGLGWERVDP